MPVLCVEMTQVGDYETLTSKRVVCVTHMLFRQVLSEQIVGGTTEPVVTC